MVLVKLRISRGVVIVLVHPAVVRVLIRRGGAAGPHVVLVFRIRGILTVLVLHFVVDAITVVSRSVEEVVAYVSFVVRWGIKLTNFRRISTNLSPYITTCSSSPADSGT